MKAKVLIVEDEQEIGELIGEYLDREGIETTLVDYALESVTSGKDAVGRVRVTVKSANRTVSGLGVDTDIIVASAKAFINALNKIRAADPANRKPKRRKPDVRKP